MYRCEICNVVLPPRTRASRVTVQTRAAEYPSRPKAQKQRVGRKLKHADDPGGAGFEIAKEALACPSCALTVEAERIETERAEEAAELTPFASLLEGAEPVEA